MKVIVAEKPSVARDIARVLKVTGKKEGYIDGNGYAITWAFGHLVQLSDPDKYDPKFKRWNFYDLPIIPESFIKEVPRKDTTKKQFNVIKSLLSHKDTQEVICATDAGREGELIFRLIYEQSKCQKPIKRLWISSQTDKAIKEGFNQLKPGEEFNPLFDSAMCRSEADWLIGMNATRAYTIKFSQGAGVMSVGRVQTPVLKMIVDRHKAHTDFKPETFYEITAEINHENGNFNAKWINDKKETRFSKEEDAKAVIDHLLTNPNGKIAKLTTKQKKEKQPLLYDLTELQRDANKQFKFSADRTLKIMQSLYENHKVLTYPRTSSRYLSEDMVPKLPELIQNLSDISDYHDIATRLSAQPLPINKRIVDDKKVTDHHAIIPTDKKPDISKMNTDERKVFDLVIKRFLSVFLPECIKDHTEIISDFSNHKFRTSGTVIKQAGWREPYLKSKPNEESQQNNGKEQTKQKSNKKDTEVLLPIVNENDPIKHNNMTMEKGETKPPALYNEASILAAMETAGKDIEDEELRVAMKDCGLGTPATRAQILERLIQVGYMIREKNRLIPTEKGIHLISCIQSDALLSPELTGNWEKKLNDMSQNNYKRESYMSEIAEFTDNIVTNVKNSEGGDDISENPDLGNCPKCNAKIFETNMAFNCESWKEKECDFVIWKNIAGQKVTQKLIKQLLTDGKTELVENFKSKAGKVFNAHLVLKDDKVSFDFGTQNEPIGKCTVCKEGDITINSKAYSCSNWRDGCKFVIWRTVAGRAISMAEAKQLIKDGITAKLKGFKSRAGKPFDAILVLEEGKVSFKFEE